MAWHPPYSQSPLFIGQVHKLRPVLLQTSQAPDIWGRDILTLRCCGQNNMECGLLLEIRRVVDAKLWLTPHGVVATPWDAFSINPISLSTPPFLAANAILAWDIDVCPH